MVNLLAHLDSEIKEMINLSYQLGKLCESLLWYSDLDSEFYNKKKCEELKIKISKIQERLFFLKEKWLNVK